ncbi:hypothetical protein BJ165DRAFT_1447076 [Panaeolus papilionaceus]|nr:hypothetical protein BJ165DRAFT_1447076 [Panaeolus papilionaceus]
MNGAREVSCLSLSRDWKTLTVCWAVLYSLFLGNGAQCTWARNSKSEIVQVIICRAGRRSIGIWGIHSEHRGTRPSQH